MKIFFISILITAMPVFGVFAGEFPPLLEKALSNMNKTDYAACTYILTTTTENKKTVEEHNPFLKQPLKWKLLEINGKKPTKAEISEYRKEKLKELKKREGEKGRLNLRTMFKKSTVQFLKEENGRVIYSFRPVARSKDKKKIMPYLFGEVSVNKDKVSIESIILRNRKPFSPAFSFKVNAFLMAMSFKPYKGDGPFLLNSVTTKVEGKVMGIKKISKNIKVQYSNYRFHDSNLSNR